MLRHGARGTALGACDMPGINASGTTATTIITAPIAADSASGSQRGAPGSAHATKSLARRS